VSRGAVSWIDAIRLAVGTLTILPVRPPDIVDRRVGGWAMTLAPAVGGALAVLVVVPLWVLELRQVTSMLAAALVVGALALLTRAMHLDGLADTADGLGSGRPAADALAVMRKGDVGPFGVCALLLVLLVQVAALTQHVSAGRGALAVVVALVVSRLVLPLVCSRGIPPARPDGLGRLVAGSVGRGQVLLSAGLATAVLVGFATTSAAGPGRFDVELAFAAMVAAGIGLLCGMALCWWCVRRLGGITGDVMGACVEVTFTATLVVLTLL
jgi:adenosylcobinamide-GDP ribazoletransferase